eukprot:707277-Rhodomonas_salina.2
MYNQIRGVHAYPQQKSDRDSLSQFWAVESDDGSLCLTPGQAGPWLCSSGLGHTRGRWRAGSEDSNPDNPRFARALCRVHLLAT